MRIPALRLLLPGVLGLSALALTALSTAFELREADRRVRTHGSAALSSHLYRLDLDLALGWGAVDRPAIRRWLSAIAVDSNFNVLVLVDDRHRVLLSGRGAGLGEPAAAISAYDPALAGQVTTRRVGIIQATQDDRLLCGYTSFPLATDADGLRPHRLGVVYGEYDLGLELDEARRVVWNSSVRQGAIALLFTLGLGLALHLLITLRMQRLAATMARIAGGDYGSRCRIAGRDEIAQVAQAFDALAEQVQNERQALELSRQRYQQLVEGTADLVTVVDGTGRITFVNAMAPQVYGLPPKDCLDLNAFDFIHPDDRERTRLWLQHCVRTRCERGSIENRQIDRDGQVRTLMWNCRFHYQADGTCCRVDSVARDLTARIEAESAIRTANGRFKALFEGARDTIILSDPESGLITAANRQAELLLGRERASLVGSPLATLHPTDPVPGWQSPVDQGGATLTRTEVLHRDGSCIPVEISTSVIHVTDGHALVQSMVRDIREREHLEERLRQAEKLAAMGQLAGGIAHDFNNQLAGISGFAELLASQLEDPRRQRWAMEIHSAAKRAADLTRQLLAFARQGQTLNAPTDLNRCITEVVALMGHDLDRRIAIETRLEAANCLCKGDPGQLHHALLNLAVNAREAMPAGGRLCFATRNRELDAQAAGPGILPGQFIEITVSDTGCGMDAEVRRHLFEPFFTTKEQGKGTGMGLAAVYGVVRNHGGTISVASEPGHGSTFTLYLPQCPPAAEDSVSGQLRALDRHGRGRALSILVVDDEAVVRDMTRELLQEQGHRVEVCGDGSEAVERFRQQQELPDLVLLDMVMPKLGGRETFLALRGMHPDLHVLLASGHCLNREIQDLLDRGACGFLQKPFRMHELHKAVCQAAGLPAAQAAGRA